MSVARNAIGVEGFEALYRRASDPWDTHASRFEAYKRQALLAACGSQLRARILELGCGAGAITAALARRGLRVTAVDGSPSALAAAAAFLGDAPRVRLSCARLPRGMPRGPFELIVISEVAYYLSPRDLADLCVRVGAALSPGGRLVLLHHQTSFDDAAQLPAMVHERIWRLLPGLRMRRDSHRGRWRITVLDSPRR